MKKTVLFLLIFVFMQVIIVFAQECVPYLPMKQGAAWETQHFDGRNKLTATEKCHIKEITTKDSNILLQVESESYDNKGKFQGRNNYLAGCQNGVFYLNMRSNADPNGMSAVKDMHITINADNLIFPVNLLPGQILNTGKFSVEAKISGVPGGFKMSVSVYNRKVEGSESITTSAGTFDCLKISCTIKTNMMGEVKTKGIEWYAKDIGLVRSEIHDLKGKLLSYTVMSLIK